MLIFLDADGVLFSFNKSLFKLLNLNYNDEKLRNGLKNDYHFIEKLVGVKKYEQVVLDAKEGFWTHLEILPWAFDLYNGCCKTVGEENVYFLTSYGHFLDAPGPKVKRLLQDFNSKRVFLAHDKFLLAGPGRVLIDDKPKNITLFKEYGGIGELFPCEFLFLDGNFDVNLYLEKLFNKLKDFKNGLNKA